MLDFTTGCSLETLHHVIPQSKISEGFKVLHQDNLLFLNRKKHMALHTIFGDVTPQEQINMLAGFHIDLLSENVKSVINDLIKLSPLDFYSKDLLDSEYFEKRKRSKKGMKKKLILSKISPDDKDLKSFKTFFSNQKPREQFALLYKLNSIVLSEFVQHVLLLLIKMSPEEFYSVDLLNKQ